MATDETVLKLPILRPICLIRFDYVLYMHFLYQVFLIDSHWMCFPWVLLCTQDTTDLVQ